MTNNYSNVRISPVYTLSAILAVCLFLSSCAGGRAKKADAVIQTARSYTGVPYKYGGTTRAGMDCSALLYHSYGSINIKLPRTSEQQAKEGKRVALHELRVGDLVFFATGKKRRQITHAGIVTSVKGRNDVRFIHASTSLGVTESNLYSDYYKKRFRKARRVL
ncbi:NlpC/P60 family protein [Roseivirga pacifica]|nr:NlpC/P60 family protein [Roseivirga pacifica]MCO6365427.1 NlpC/P60 family protein [Roseivirga pacifica]MCO6371843.1 NlpC/P60 family protein [Roseivirga pacifica]MCO6376046.1 NlpC/P60 family protein [Roseivirga pacifica]MCO6379221.1 NlpC/P60 family protein [Roseivirga pacifica]